MAKTAIVHTRVAPEIKEQCDDIFTKLGITTSYAITLFLNQVALRKGLPFDVSLPKEDKQVSDVDWALNISSTAAPRPEERAIEILKMVEDGLIDEETAKSIFIKMYAKK